MVIREAALPPTHWRIANLKSFLGECLTRQEKYKDAEPLLLDSHTALRTEKDVPPSAVAKASGSGLQTCTPRGAARPTRRSGRRLTASPEAGGATQTRNMTLFRRIAPRVPNYSIPRKGGGARLEVAARSLRNVRVPKARHFHNRSQIRIPPAA